MPDQARHDSYYDCHPALDAGSIKNQKWMPHHVRHDSVEGDSGSDGFTRHGMTTVRVRPTKGLSVK